MQIQIYSLDRELEIMFWMSVNAIIFFIAFFTGLRAKTNPQIESEQRKIAYTWTIFLLLLGMANVISLVNRLYWGFLLSIDKITILMVNGAFLIKILEVEKYFRPLKFRIFSLIQFCVILGYSVIGNVRSSNVVNYVLIFLLIIGFSIFPLMYLYVAITSTGPVRIMAIKIFIAILAFAFGISGQRHNVIVYLPDTVYFFENVLHMPFVLAPSALLLGGVILLFDSYYRTLF
jgi:hypothetical protein